VIGRGRAPESAMTAPENQKPRRDESAASTHAPVPAPHPLTTLKRRADFLSCARARRAHTPGMLVQGRRRPAGEAASETDGVRVGFTCSKKVSKAVVRNRAKRRLREAARAVLPRLGRAGWDYVLVGRAEATVSRPFADLMGDLAGALAKIHGSGR